MTSPAEKLASMKVKMIGIQLKIMACVGSGGGGLSFICSHMVTPMISGHGPRWRNGPITGTTVGSHGISPNRLNTVSGSGAERSLIQPKNGACRRSMVTNNTLYSAKKTGTWMTIGRQPATGLIFSLR